MFKDQAGRHYWFAENLKKQGYNPSIFCASTLHNSSEIIDTGNEKYSFKETNGIPFVFVKTPKYFGNRLKRIRNMYAFYKNLFNVTKEFSKTHGKPDVIIASSVHPLTLLAGIKIAKKMSIPCICEVRDLWPESIVAYGILKRNSIISKLLYQGEKWIYKKADSIIMTWEGGKDYIVDQGWDSEIDIGKVKHINNGIVLDTFDDNSEKYNLSDQDLYNKEYKNIVYTGSIRKVNNIGMLLDSAKVIQSQGRNDIRFLIYGSGNELEGLINRCKSENIHNVIFKGHVEKKFIPSILKSSYINILHNSSTSLDRYGQSQNKLFEYLAAGKCIVQTYSTGYNICNKFNCGTSIPEQSAEEIAKAILNLSNDENSRRIMGINAREAAYEYDFTRLTERLIGVIESGGEK